MEKLGEEVGIREIGNERVYCIGNTNIRTVFSSLVLFFFGPEIHIFEILEILFKTLAKFRGLFVYTESPLPIM